MNIGQELLEILGTIKRNQEQIDLLQTNNTRLTSHLYQTGFIQNLGGLQQLQELLNGNGSPPPEVSLRGRRQRPPLKMLQRMGVPIEHVEAVSEVTEAEREDYAKPEKPNRRLVDGVDISPSKMIENRKILSPGGSARYRKIFANDPKGKYLHQPDGSIKLRANGKLWEKREMDEAQRLEIAKRQKAYFASLSRKEQVAIANKRLKTMRANRKIS